MMQLIRLVVLAMISFQLMSCASYMKRQECEKVNWFEYGRGLALSGKFIEQDTLIKECKEAEAKMSFSQLDLGFKAGRDQYCSPEQIFTNGKAGEVLEFNFCDGMSKQVMDMHYQRGLKEFCTPASGLDYGSKGKLYKNVCKGKAEEAFLPEYKKGRKKFLNASIIELEKKSIEADREISNIRRDKDQKMLELAILPRRTHTETTRVYDSFTNSYKTETKQVEDPIIESRRNQVQGDIDSLGRKLQKLESQQSMNREEASRMRVELSTLD